MRSLTVTADQVAAFRLARHHLVDPRDTASIVSVSSEVCGIQAQIMSAAELALWTRCRTATRPAIQKALWTDRTLVKTSLMRVTLHLVPASDYHLYNSALKETRMGMVRRTFARMKVTAEETAAMNATLLDALETGPLTQQELVARVRRGASKRMQFWLKYASSAFRPAIAEGLICYGPPRGPEVTLVRVDRWLPASPAIDEKTARQTLGRRFLAAYGPADAGDFRHWSGVSMPEAKAVWQSIAPDIEEVSVDGEKTTILRRDAAALRASTLDASAVRLLPSFDPLLLAHARKDHLIAPRHYKRVYRNQGWVSPVVLVGGRIAGVWLLRSTVKTLTADVELFTRVAGTVRKKIEEEADAAGGFLGTPCSVAYK